MGELGIRWIIAASLLMVSGWSGIPNFDRAWPIALCWALLSSILFRFDRTNPGIAGFCASLDGIALVTVASAADRMGSLGWVGAIPIAYSVVRYGSRPLPAASLVCGGMLVAHALFHRIAPPGIVYAQMLAVFALAWTLRYGRQVQPAPAEHVGPTDPLGDPSTFLALRESFRQLKTLYKQLEWQSRRDRNIAGLQPLRLIPGHDFSSRMTQKLCELTGAEGAVVYRAVENASGFACSTAEGNVLTIDPNGSAGMIVHAAERELSKQYGVGHVACVALSHKGQITGICTVTAGPERLDDVRIAAEELAPCLADLLDEIDQRMTASRRAACDKLRLDLALARRGSKQSTAIAERFVAQLTTIYTLDHVSVHGARGPLASAGRQVDVSEWTGRECFAPIASNHPEIGVEMGLKRRIGTLAIIKAAGLTAHLVSATEGSLTMNDVDTVKVLLSDLAWSFDDGIEEAGLLSAEAFRSRMTVAGALTLFEITERKEKSSYDLGQTASSLRSRVLNLLPAGAGVFIRTDGDILVHLPKTPLGAAAEWGQRVITHLPGTRMRTASLWPRVQAAVSDEVAEPETVFNLSNV